VKKLYLFIFFIVISVFTVFSYGFRDPNLNLSDNQLVRAFTDPLFHIVYYQRPVASIVFFFFLVFLFVSYFYILKNPMKNVVRIVVIAAVILSLSYPALTHDLFNYITTAKVAFFHRENPYIVMPIEIPGEQYLAFTRAANKVALYGPVWLLLTALPHYMGNNTVWQTIISFKLLALLGYLAFVFLILKVTKSEKNVLFFALNPLILIETLVSGHNDIFMMILACTGLLVWQKQKILGIAAVCASALVKGATIVLLPFLFFRGISRETLLRYVYGSLAFVFFVFAPLREELYPWYAVWLVCITSLMDMKKNAMIISFTIVLSFALELRHLPYMWMGYYEGPGPPLRFIVTIIPIALYFGWIFRIYAKKYFCQK